MPGKAVCIIGFCVHIAVSALAEDSVIDRTIDDHVLPGYRLLVQEASSLANAAKPCNSGDPELREKYHTAFDAWVRVSHLRFGPSEVDDRAFAFVFWPDTKGKTPKVLRSLILTSDPVVESAERFRTVSVAGRGFHALEFMLYDPAIAELVGPGYRCALIRAITADIAESATAILKDWENVYADLMRTAGTNDIFRDRNEALRQLFTALTTALQFTSETRLGRPLGKFDRPRPNRSEARRSGRSLAHVVLSLEATRELAAFLSDNDPALDAAFEGTIARANRLADPVFLGVTNPQGRLMVEALQQSIDHVRHILRNETGPRIGLTTGFNLLDGD